jgi:predicted RNA binding protein YcfA (HicA-like mRNA interferase family)
MLKVPALTPQKIAKVLEKKGFVLDRIRGSHRIYYNPEGTVYFSSDEVGGWIPLPKIF